MHCRAIWSCACLLICCGAAGATDKHALTLDEFFRLEDIHAVSFSPNGRRLAFVRSRARSTKERYVGGRLLPHQREDVWIAELDRPTKLKKITSGDLNGSSYWHPLWSPDGNRLLVLTDEGFDNVHLEVIDLLSGKTKIISRRGIDLEAEISGVQATPLPRSSLSSTVVTPACWLDSHRVLFEELAPGEVSFALSEGTRQIEAISRAWRETESGRYPSFSRVDSIPLESPRPKGRLVIANIDTGKVTEIAEGIFHTITISPSGRFAALIAEGAPIRLSASDLIHFPRVFHTYSATINYHTKFAIVRFGYIPQIHWFPEVIDPGYDFVPHGPNGSPKPGEIETYTGPVWFSQSDRVVALAKAEVSESNSDELYIVDARQMTVSRIPHQGLGVFNVSVLGDRLYLRGTEHTEAVYEPNGNYSWYRAERGLLAKFPPACNGSSNNLMGLTGNLGVIIDPVNGGICLVPSDGPPRYIEFSELKGASVLWPNDHQLSPRGSGSILVETQEGEFEITQSLRDGVNVQSIAPHGSGDIAGFLPSAHVIAEISRSQSGVELDVAQGNGWRSIVKLNAFLDQVAVPAFIDLTFDATDGRKSSARLFMPSGPVHGAVPVITWVYISMGSDLMLSNNNLLFENMALALQYGFAVLVPTINPAAYSFAFSPYRSLPRDVVPAVEAAIASGLVDPRRIYLYGHSYGAYSTYSLIEQTDVFAAAAAMNGPSDLVNEYLEMDPNVRFHHSAFAHPFSVQGELESEHNFMALGTTPWSDPERYVENSPLRQIDRIHTPLLIFHSDTDVFDMAQSDEMFVGLVRLGKEARYVRFWGEPHSLDSPANIRQFWLEMTKWFRDHQKEDDL